MDRTPTSKKCWVHEFPTPVCGAIAGVNTNSELILLYFLGKHEREQVVALLESRGYQPEWNAEAVGAVEQQITEYFNGKRKTFDLPLAPEGTPFQQRVWKELLNI